MAGLARHRQRSLSQEPGPGPPAQRSVDLHRVPIDVREVGGTDHRLLWSVGMGPRWGMLQLASRPEGRPCRCFFARVFRQLVLVFWWGRLQPNAASFFKWGPGVCTQIVAKGYVVDSGDRKSVV